MFTNALKYFISVVTVCYVVTYHGVSEIWSFLSFVIFDNMRGKKNILWSLEM